MKLIRVEALERMKVKHEGIVHYGIVDEYLYDYG